jgi:hypothetical protein
MKLIHLSYLIILLFVSQILLAGCSTQPAPNEIPVVGTPTISSETPVVTATSPSPEITIENVESSTTEIPVQKTTPQPIITQESPILTPVPVPTSKILSYQAIPLVFTPPGTLHSCTPYEAVIRSPCEAYFTWINYAFEYRSLGYPVSIPYNKGAFALAEFNYTRANEQLKKDSRENKIGNYTYGSTVPLEDRISYYSAIINDPAQEPTYNYLLHHLREIRTKQKLDDNEYAELIARFVQRSIPYYTDEDDWVVKYPIQTIAKKAGDCDDKSLLLAGLLSREGYGVALIEFPDAGHLIVGILGDHETTEYDGYLGIEPTVESYIGFYHTKAAFLFTTDAYYADFKVLKISDGKAFTAGNELKFIWDKWSLFKGYTDTTEYVHDDMFVSTNIDNRHMVYQYLTKTGMFA